MNSDDGLADGIIRFVYDFKEFCNKVSCLLFVICYLLSVTCLKFPSLMLETHIESALHE